MTDSTGRRLVDYSGYQEMVRNNPDEIVVRFIGLNVAAVFAYFLYSDVAMLWMLLLYDVLQVLFLVLLFRMPGLVPRYQAFGMRALAGSVLAVILSAVIYCWVVFGAEGKVLAVLLLMAIALYAVSMRVHDPVQSRIEASLVCVTMAIMGCETVITQGFQGVQISMTLGIFGILAYFIMAALAAFRTHEELRAARKAEIDHARMQAIGQLVGGVAHDFNNLLTVIQGNLELRRVLQRSGGSLIEAERLIREVEDAAERAAQSTRQLLAYSRKTYLAVTAEDLGALVQELEPFLSRTLPAPITLEVHSAPGLAQVNIDKAQIENVVLNVVINARDAMEEEGGVIVLDAAETQDARGARYVELSVQDDGSGMAPDVLSRVTEPYFTTKAPGKGTGLGLSNARGIVEQLGGIFSVTSELGLGTRVSMSFPVLSGEDTETSEPPSVPEVMPQGAAPALKAGADTKQIQA